MKLEPLFWGAFSVGGTVAALILPIHIFLNNIAPQLGWISADAIAYETIARLLSNPLVKIYLIITMVLMFFYAVHRFSSVPHELLLNMSKHTAVKVGYTLMGIFAIATLIITIIAP